MDKNQSVHRAEQDEDNELVRRFKNGEESAFDELFKKYQGKVFSLAFRLLNNREDALDLVCETFVRTYQGLSKFRGEAKFFTWLYQICYNLALNFRKKRSREKDPIKEIGEDEFMNLPGLRTSESELYQKDLKGALEEAVNKLSAQQKAVFTLHQLQGLTYQEISKIIGCSLNTTKVHYFKAVRNLREFLKDWL